MILRAHFFTLQFSLECLDMSLTRDAGRRTSRISPASRSPRRSCPSTSTACRRSSSFVEQLDAADTRASSRWRTRSPGRCSACARTKSPKPTSTRSTSATLRASQPACTSCPRSSNKRDRIGDQLRMTDLHRLTLAELTRACARAGFPASSSRATSRPHRAAQPALNAFITVTARARAGRRRRGRCARSRAGEARSAHGRAARAQGHLLHRRRPHHLRLAHARQLRRALRRHCRRAAGDSAGMVMLGKTNMDEFAMGSSNETSFYGPVRTRGIRTRCRAARRAARPRRSPRASRPPRPAPTPAARSASPPRCAASPASSRPTVACRATA